MIIAHNMLANNAIRQSDITGKKKTKATERLASGYRINRAADDAAGLSISEKMRGQIRGLTRASQNVQDGISFIQTGDGALEEVQSMLQRIRELAVQASNDTNTEDDRASIDKEVQQLKDEMDRVFNESEFNTLPIFHAPYIPDIEGMPSDFEFYNTPDGLGVEGILINHKRYTPLELGCPTTPEHDDWELKFTDDNEEFIHLKLAANEPLSKMHRVYQYEADETGIKINNLYATTWDTINKNDNTYSFSYHGMNISFTMEVGDTLDEMINNINGDGTVIKSMEAIPIGQSVPTSAVNREGGSMAVYVTNNNKNHIANWRYQMVANDYGIYLREIYRRDGVNHTQFAWSDILGGPHSISDWGTPDEISDESALASASNGSHYYYQDFAVMEKPAFFLRTLVTV